MVKPGWLTQKVQQNSEVFWAGARMVSGFNVLLGGFSIRDRYALRLRDTRK